jgi:hypothetical protein
MIRKRGYSLLRIIFWNERRGSLVPKGWIRGIHFHPTHPVMYTQNLHYYFHPPEEEYGVGGNLYSRPG